ncbi:bifunctional folylpolyglutamate synthase/dihydrofolate synthase [Candidatus Thioglobus sp.]|nr:bifunctional folylpolyglutamate synthase/dihydrofolate synthase [Candidatus Thioglobus sp.]
MGGLKTLSQWLTWQESCHTLEIDLGLERIQSVYSKLFPNGVPFTTITVAGTNGKGSTVAFIESVYLKTSFKVAKFTSPHILNYNERFIVKGSQATDQQICDAFEEIEKVRDSISLTYFEFSTLAALLIFAKQKVDIAILEVGLGGRLDSTNVVDTDIAVITNIAIDHVDYLGDTRELIGHEKSGIMRANTPCVCGDIDPPKSIQKHADTVGALLEFVKQPYTGTLSLKGDHQQQNAGLAALCIKKLDYKFAVDDTTLRQGLESTQIEGRFQAKKIHNKYVIFDVAHNEAAVHVLAQELAKDKQPTLAIFSALKDKNIAQMIGAISPNIDEWLLVPLDVHRAADMNFLIDQFPLKAAIHAFDSMNLAINQALKQHSYQRIVIFGSFHVVADALKILK